MAYEKLTLPRTCWSGTYGSKVVTFTIPVAISPTAKKLIATFKSIVADGSTTFVNLRLNGAFATGNLVGFRTTQFGGDSIYEYHLGTPNAPANMELGYSPVVPFLVGDWSLLKIELPLLSPTAAPRPFLVDHYLRISHSGTAYHTADRSVGQITNTGAITSIGVATGGGGSYWSAASEWTLEVL